MLLTERLWKWGWNCCVAPLGYVPGGNRILIAGYRPAQKFVIERTSCAHWFGNSH